MDKQNEISKHLERISILLKRMERVTNIVMSKKDSAKSIQGSLIIIQIALQVAMSKAQLMYIQSQQIPVSHKQGVVMSSNEEILITDISITNNALNVYKTMKRT